MNSIITEEFIKCFNKLPQRIKNHARKAYKLWKENPNHPGLHYKKIHNENPIYSIRIGIGWRAIGICEKDEIIWFWIGSHEDYNNIIKNI